jgi:hypothetical protein
MLNEIANLTESKWSHCWNQLFFFSISTNVDCLAYLISILFSGSHCNAFNCPWAQAHAPSVLQEEERLRLCLIAFITLLNKKKTLWKPQCSFHEGGEVVCVFTPLSMIWRRVHGWRHKQSNRLWTNNCGRVAGWVGTTAVRFESSQHNHVSRGRGSPFIRLPVYWTPSRA